MVKNMRKLAVCLLAALVFCNGCAIVSSTRTIEGDFEKRKVVVLGVVTIWASEEPIQKDEK